MDLGKSILCKKLRKKLHSDNDDFLNGIQLYYSSKGKKIPADFLGHCCMIKDRASLLKKQEETSAPGTSTVPPTPFDNVSRLEGALVNCGYLLMVAATTKCMDVHCLGAEPGIDATPHFVYPQKQAILAEANSVLPMSEMPSGWLDNSFETDLEITPPHIIDGDKGKNSKQKVSGKYYC